MPDTNLHQEVVPYYWQSFWCLNCIPHAWLLGPHHFLCINLWCRAAHFSFIFASNELQSLSRNLHWTIRKFGLQFLPKRQEESHGQIAIARCNSSHNSNNHLNHYPSLASYPTIIRNHYYPLSIISSWPKHYQKIPPSTTISSISTTISSSAFIQLLLSPTNLTISTTSTIHHINLNHYQHSSKPH